MLKSNKKIKEMERIFKEEEKNTETILVTKTKKGIHLRRKHYCGRYADEYITYTKKYPLKKRHFICPCGFESYIDEEKEYDKELKC